MGNAELNLSGVAPSTKGAVAESSTAAITFFSRNIDLSKNSGYTYLHEALHQNFKVNATFGGVKDHNDFFEDSMRQIVPEIKY